MRYTLKEKKLLPQSKFFMRVELPSEEVAQERNRVIERLKQETELPGFRKGFVPEKIIRERFGEMALWEEAAEHALSEALMEILRAEKLDALGRPRVETLKLAPDNPAEFKITLSLYPKLTLPDYKKIAAEENRVPTEPIHLEEQEIDLVIREIEKQHAHTTGKKDFAITEETVKEFGGFQSLTDFRAKVKEGLIARKEEFAKEKRRGRLLDAITAESRGEMLDLLIESELDRMEEELRGQIESMGGTFEDYLKNIKRDLVTLKKEWSKDAERRARLQVALFQIARAESISASAEQVEAEVRHLLEHHKGADPKAARGFVETLLTNQKVIEFLEGQK